MGMLGSERDPDAEPKFDTCHRAPPRSALRQERNFAAAAAAAGGERSKVAARPAWRWLGQGRVRRYGAPE